MRRLFASWWFWAGLGVALLALGIPAAYWWQEVREFCDAHANVLTAAGLLVAVVAFPLTLYAVLDAHRAGEQAQREIQEAVRQARAQVREAQSQAQDAINRVEGRYRQGLEALRMSLALTDAEAVSRLVAALQTAGSDGRWERAVVLCDEAQVSTARLRSTAGGINAHTAALLTTASHDLLELRVYLERSKIQKETPSPGFERSRLEALGRLTTTLAEVLIAIRQRLQEF